MRLFTMLHKKAPNKTKVYVESEELRRAKQELEELRLAVLHFESEQYIQDRDDDYNMGIPLG